MSLRSWIVVRRQSLWTNSIVFWMFFKSCKGSIENPFGQPDQTATHAIRNLLQRAALRVS